jgi:hypothetical protein
MKKIALLFVLAVMLCPAFNSAAKAEGEPLYTLSVSKHNGGILSLINLYGNVTYSETMDDMCNTINATLTCYGQGYTRCRVPSDAGNYTNNTQRVLPTGLATVINDMLEKSEQQLERGVRNGMDSKKVMSTNTSSRRSVDSRTARRPMYVYSSRWNYNDRGEGTVNVSLFEVDASVLGM